MKPEYDPNKTGDYNLDQRYELTFSQWDAHATHVVEVGGNCAGLVNIQHAMEEVYETLPSNRRGQATMVLSKADGSDDLIVEDELNQGEDWIGSMLTSARFLGFVEREALQ